MVRRVPKETDIVVISLHGMVPNEQDVPSMAILPKVLARWTFVSAFETAGHCIIQPAYGTKGCGKKKVSNTVEAF